MKANKFYWKNIKKKYFLFFNKKYLQGVPMSWLLVLLLIFAIIGNINTKLSKKYFWWIRFKDILKFVKKEETLYFYCNNKYFGKVKKNNTKIVYRILKNELKIENYSEESWKNYIKNLTLKEYDNYFDIDDKGILKSNYEKLVFKRFCKYYLRKII